MPLTRLLSLGVENFKLHFTACYAQVANRSEVPEGAQGCKCNDTPRC